MEAIVKILNIEAITHDVRRYQVQKPVGYHFNPGQATDVSIICLDGKRSGGPSPLRR